MLTGVNLSIRGCQLPSMCGLYNKSIENDIHLFLECPSAVKLYNWLQNSLSCLIGLSYFSFIFTGCKKGRSPQCSIVIYVTIIATFKVIWLCINNIRFENKVIYINYVIATIIASTSMISNTTNLTIGISIDSFHILKAFKIKTRHPKANQIKEVIWCPPNKS